MSITGISSQLPHQSCDSSSKNCLKEGAGVGVWGCEQSESRSTRLKKKKEHLENHNKVSMLKKKKAGWGRRASPLLKWLNLSQLKSIWWAQICFIVKDRHKLFDLLFFFSFWSSHNFLIKIIKMLSQRDLQEVLKEEKRKKEKKKNILPGSRTCEQSHCPSVLN